MSTPGAIAVGLWAQNQLAGVMKFKLPFTFVLMRNALSHLTLTLIEITMSLIETLIILCHVPPYGRRTKDCRARMDSGQEHLDVSQLTGIVDF